MKRPPDDLVEKLLAVSDQLTGTDLNVSVDDIAKMANVPRATLYYYFAGKEDLLSFFLSDKLHRVSVAIGKAVAGHVGKTINVTTDSAVDLGVPEGAVAV